MAENVVRIPGFTGVADTFDSAVGAFKTYCRSRNLSPNTIDYYGYCLLSFTRFIDVNHPALTPRAVTCQVIRAYLLDQTDKNSPSTACHCHTTLRVFFGYLQSEGCLESNPMNRVDKPKRRKTVIQTFSMKQVDDILTTCKRDFAGVRDKAMIMMLIDCGLRASELCGITINDFDWTDSTVLVLGKGDKERIVPFGQATRQALTIYNARRGSIDADAYFVSTLGTALDRHRLREIIEQRCALAKITGVRCSPHTLRHTCAVHYLRNGGDVFSLQKLLGHSSLDMTRKYSRQAPAL